DLQTLLVCHKSIDGIIDSFGTIGRACGKGAEAERMQRDYRDRLAKIHQGTRHLARPRVLIVLDRIYGSGHLADVYIAGHDDYFDRVIGLAGGQNAYRHGGIRYPVLSAEGILRLDPEVIVDLVPPATLKKVGRQPMLDDWKDVNTVAAVKSHRLLIFAEDYAMVPGPRFIRLVEDLARDFHPEVGRSGS
ncbi:MAG: ABC transporter substrate-binding protein, partial [Planctomycetaceae bacterium]|nr:ABC transporter substrate-binding protein [Planctomycetaceae bacterium]